MLKKIQLLLINLAISSLVFGQQTSTSPFSSIGIGEDGSLPDAQFGGFGNVSSLCFDSTIFNGYNPASYSTLSFGQPLFSIGVSAKFSTFSNAVEKYDAKTAGITNFSFGLPIGKRFGIGFGLKPFSRKGYKFSTTEFAYDDSVTFNYKGSGSSNLVFLGVAYSILKNKNTTLSIGGNLGYIFGNATNERSSYFHASSPKGGMDFTTFRMKAFHVSFGAYYQQFLNKTHTQQLFLSAVYTPQLKLNAYLDYTLGYSSDITDLNVFDTINNIDNNKGSITFPSKQTIAAGYAFSPDITKNPERLNYQLLIMTEVDLMQWKSYSENFSNHTSSTFGNTFQTRVGLQFVPNIDKNKRSTGGKYFSRIKYRIGTQFGTLPVLYHNTQLKSMSGTVGFGFPFLSQKTNSSLNISFQYGNNSNKQAGDLKETFYTISLGVIIAPSSYERWFRKYKLD